MERSSELCSELSRAYAEPLSATASRIDTWLLVEYRGVWSRDTIGGSGLSDELKAHLRRQLRAVPHSRLLFVRRPERRAHPRLAVYLASSVEGEARLLGLEVERHDELLELDIAAALGGSPPAAAQPLDHPLLVVCTHGKRDRCCARYGQPLYDEVRAQVEPTWVWQSTHVGGDRFAGNLVCLPEGLYFGRVERGDAWQLLDEYLAGRIDLAHYRGRSCHPFVVQAAERLLRDELGLARIDDVRAVGVQRLDEDAWNVRLLAGPGREEHELEVTVELGEPTHLTCGATVPQRPRHYVASRPRAAAVGG